MAMAKERPMIILWTWLDWWRVDHAALNKINRVWTPVIGVVLAAVIAFAPVHFNIFGARGIVDEVNGLLPILAGFFVASLAAVATFSSDTLDDVMGGIAPKLASKYRHTIESLTRRRFLCILFGYLAGASICMYVIGAIAVVAAPLLQLEIFRDGIVVCGLRAVFGGLYLGLLAQILLASYLGLYFLMDRIHQQVTPTGFLEVPPGDAGNTVSPVQSKQPTIPP